jgi:hypothetical protein
MHETELPVNEIKIQAQTLSRGVGKFGSTLSISQFEALAGFHSAQHTYETFCNAILIGDLPSFFLLSDLAVDVNVGPFGCFSHGSGMLFDLLGVFSDKHLEILEQKTLGDDKSLHVFCPTDGQVSLEQNSIKTGYRSVDFLCMLIDKLFQRFESLLSI